MVTYNLKLLTPKLSKSLLSKLYPNVMVLILTNEPSNNASVEAYLGLSPLRSPPGFGYLASVFSGVQ